MVQRTICCVVTLGSTEHYDTQFTHKENEMKKIVIATVLALTAGLASAQGNFGGIEYNYREGYGADKGTDQNGYTLTLGTSVAKDTTVDLKSVFRRTDGSGDITNRLEAGLTRNLDIGNGFAGYGRVAIGEKWNEGTNFSYYSIEPSVVIPVPSTKLSTELGWRYRNAYDSAANADETRTWRAGIKYNLSKEHTVGLRYDNVRGDTNQNVVAVNYSRNF